jgi:hypothetical protein
MTGIGARPSLPDASAKVVSFQDSGRSAWAAGPSLHARDRGKTRHVTGFDVEMPV